ASVPTAKQLLIFSTYCNDDRTDVTRPIHLIISPNYPTFFYFSLVWWHKERHTCMPLPCVTKPSKAQLHTKIKCVQKSDHTSPRFPRIPSIYTVFKEKVEHKPS
uniref:Uncharacterized protein n=1 Tax=Oryza brachyantha TaxID=4533 RepID=J3KVT5_ORYBR